MRHLLTAVSISLALSPTLRALDEPQEASPESQRGRYQAVLKDYERAAQEIEHAFQEAKTDAERKSYRAKFADASPPYARRFLAIADSAPSDPVAIDALYWCVQHGGTERNEALDRLASRHARERRMFRFIGLLTLSMTPSAERFLGAVAEKNPDRDVRRRALLTLGQSRKHMADQLRKMLDGHFRPDQWEEYAGAVGLSKAEFESFRRKDPDALEKQAEVAFEQVVKGSRAGATGRDDPLYEAARAELYEIRNLAVGKPAPEVTGEDIDGQPLRLIDQRGKVVVMSFWGTWCRSCMALIPRERALAKRMAGRWRADRS